MGIAKNVAINAKRDFDLNYAFDITNYIMLRVFTLLSILLIIFVLTDTGSVMLNHQYLNVYTSENQINLYTNNKSSSKEYITPETIYFPTEGNKIRIEHTFLDTQTYYTSSDSANYVLIDSNGINKDVIFAHARKKLFSNIADLNSNSIFYLKKDDKIYIYELNNTQTVKQDDFDLVSKPGFEELEIFTCVGDNDEYRQLLSAKLVNSYIIGKKGEI